MFKGLGWIGFGVFVLMNTLLVQSGPGLGFFIGAAFVVILGCGSVFLLNLPDGFFKIYKGLHSPMSLDASELVTRLEEISSLIRQDGLLALESRRKDLKDSNLSYLLKRIMDGFEAKDLIPWIQNQRKQKMEQLQVFEDVLDRVLGLLPSVGLVSSLILISGVLSGSDRGREIIGMAHVFTPFLMTLGVQLLLDSEFGKMRNEFQLQFEQYFSTLESGISGIQSGLNPELLSDRLRIRIQTGNSWAAK
jgi:flagellar motor component MotA